MRAVVLCAQDAVLEDKVLCLAVAHNRVWAGACDALIRVFDLDLGPLWVGRGHTHWVTALMAYGSFMLSASYDSEIRIWYAEAEGGPARSRPTKHNASHCHPHAITCGLRYITQEQRLPTSTHFVSLILPH